MNGVGGVFASLMPPRSRHIERCDAASVAQRRTRDRPRSVPARTANFEKPARRLPIASR